MAEGQTLSISEIFEPLRSETLRLFGLKSGFCHAACFSSKNLFLFGEKCFKYEGDEELHPLEPRTFGDFFNITDTLATSFKELLPDLVKLEVEFQEGSEKTLFYSIVRQVLSKLCSTVTLSHQNYSGIHQRQKAMEKVPANIATEDIGFGSPNTWHGEPDARLRMKETALVHSSSMKGSSSSSSAEELDVVRAPLTRSRARKRKAVAARPGTTSSSDGALVHVEAKQVLHTRCLPQLVTTAVTSAYIDKNRHHSDRFVPTLLIDGTYFRVALFCVSTDTLYISKLIKYVDYDYDDEQPARLIPSGVLGLFLIIRHIKSIQAKPTEYKEEQYRAGIKTRLELENALEHFQKLSQKSIKFLKRERDEVEENGDGSEPIVMSPPKRRPPPQ